jgi:hypothetical protein
LVPSAKPISMVGPTSISTLIEQVASDRRGDDRHEPDG